MAAVTIRPAGLADVARLNTALRALSAGMGDSHRARDADLAQAGVGATPAFHALLAERGGETLGVAVYSPLYSTTRGRAGAYVSDLWVAAEVRGKRLGQRLLCAVRDRARAQWGGGFLRLAVYADNPGAQVFYTRLGFGVMQGDIWMTLEGPALDAIGGPE